MFRTDRPRAEMSAAHSSYREQVELKGIHRRTPGIVADLFISWERFLGFAHETEALTRGEAEGYRARAWSALIEVARRQSEHQRQANPVDRFFALLRSAIATVSRIAIEVKVMIVEPGDTPAMGRPRRLPTRPFGCAPAPGSSTGRDSAVARPGFRKGNKRRQHYGKEANFGDLDIPQ